MALVVQQPARRSHNENLNIIARSMGNTIDLSRRLQLEEASLVHDPPDSCAANPTSPDRMEWMAAIVGPEDTPYSGGVFYLSLGLYFKKKESEFI